MRTRLTRLAFVLLLAGAALPVRASQPESESKTGHWAFQPVTNHPLPAVRQIEWPRNPIDQFILAKLEAHGLQPAPPADRATLLRRLSLDLIGLPPSPEELAAFLAAPSERAYLDTVERLLASPHYGERWARHWLDLARYADSEGFKADETRPYAWRYRDYVIRSFNQDKPYDRFIREQLAGDELWPEDPEALVATAFNRHYPDESNARNLRQRRQEILNDVTDTVGAVFTGLTFACARCHDHKYDPISQADYYRLQAFFANTTADDRLILAPGRVRAEIEQRHAEWETLTRAIREEMAAIEAPERRKILDDYIEKYPAEIQEALNTEETERNPFQRLMVAKAKLYIDPSSHQYIASTATVAGRLKGEDKARWDQLNAGLKRFAHLQPELPVGTGMRDIGPVAPPTHRLDRGGFESPLEEVEPALLADLGFPKPILQPMGASSRRRAALAELLVSPDNPLTARVMVNRVWQYHFGRGLVGTPSDLGTKGDRPTHPALLDWLAAEFVQNGWSLKQLHRLIVTSSVYRQSTRFEPVHAAIDPGNQWLWRYPRRRLEAESIRDSILAVSGLLNPAMGGPGIFPRLPEGMRVSGGWPLTTQTDERNRRSIYIFVRRNTRYPMFLAFDMPDTHESCARRGVTTSPVQALALLNSELSLEWAQAFAGRVLRTAASQTDARIIRAYQLAFSRSPSQAELETARQFLADQRAILAERLAVGEQLALPQPNSLEPADGAALVDLCHMLFNANEFVYQN